MHVFRKDAVSLEEDTDVKAPVSIRMLGFSSAPVQSIKCGVPFSPWFDLRGSVYRLARQSDHLDSVQDPISSLKPNEMMSLLSWSIIWQLNSILL